MKSIILKKLSVNSRSGSKSGYVGLVIALLCLLLVISFPLPPLPFGLPDTPEESGFITRVDLVRLTIEKWSGDDELFVTAHLKNSSKSTARSVSALFPWDNVGPQFTRSKAAGHSRDDRISIAPAQEMKIPVAPLSEFLATFQSRCPGCAFLGISKDTRMPIEDTAQLCKHFLARGKPCHLEYGIFPIILAKQFSVVSGESFSGQQTVFVYLSRTTTAENSVPIN